MRIDELNALFFPLSEEISSINGERVGNLNRTELVKKVIQNPDNVQYRQSYYSSPLNVATRISNMEKISEYIQRKKIIENRQISIEIFIGVYLTLKPNRVVIVSFLRIQMLRCHSEYLMI